MAAVKVYWITAGVGFLALLAGVAIYVLSDQQVGVIVIICGLGAAVLGLLTRLGEWYMRGKSA